MKSNKAKRILATLMLSTMVLGQASTVSAGDRDFGPFTWTTTSRDERLYNVKTKKKADNEQRWYLTLTRVDGLGTEKSNPHGHAIATSKAPYGTTAPIALFKSNKNRTVSQSYGKSLGAKKNKYCTLQVGGNSNNKKTYKITIKGRYCS